MQRDGLRGPNENLRYITRISAQPSSTIWCYATAAWIQMESVVTMTQVFKQTKTQNSFSVSFRV